MTNLDKIIDEIDKKHIELNERIIAGEDGTKADEEWTAFLRTSLLSAYHAGLDAAVLTIYEKLDKNDNPTLIAGLLYAQTVLNGLKSQTIENIQALKK